MRAAMHEFEWPDVLVHEVEEPNYHHNSIPAFEFVHPTGPINSYDTYPEDIVYTSTRGRPDTACNDAAEDGDLVALQRLRGRDPPSPWSVRTCEVAAEYGHLHVIKWLRAQDPPCPWDKFMCRRAADGGYIHILEWALAQDPPCPWDEYEQQLTLNQCSMAPVVLDSVMWMRDTRNDMDWSIEGRNEFLEQVVEIGSFSRIQWAFKDARRVGAALDSDLMGAAVTYLVRVNEALAAVIPKEDLVDVVTAYL